MAGALLHPAYLTFPSSSMKYQEPTKLVDYGSMPKPLQLRRHFDADNVMATGLAVLLRLPDGTPDLTIAREILAFGMFPTPLSAWYASAETSRSGLLLGVPTSPTKEFARSCDRLVDIIRRFS